MLRPVSTSKQIRRRRKRLRKRAAKQERSAALTLWSREHRLPYGFARWLNTQGQEPEVFITMSDADLLKLTQGHKLITERRFMKAVNS
jgi:hypothetical protein